MIFGKYINKYYKKFALLYIIGIIALSFVDVANSLVPSFIKDIINNLDTIEEKEFVLIIWKIVIAALVMLAGRVIYRICIFYSSRKIQASLRDEMFNKATRLSSRYYSDNKIGNIMSWFTSDIDVIGEYFGWGTVMMIDATVGAIVVFIRMVMLNWAITIVCLIPMGLIVLWGFLVEKQMARMWDNRQEAFDNLYDFANENFIGIRVIKAFVKENKQIFAFSKVARKNRDVNYNFTKVSMLFSTLIELLITSIVVIILGLGGILVYKTAIGETFVLFGQEIKFTIGELVEFNLLFDLIIWPMIALGQIITMRSRTKASLKRVTNFLDSEEDIKNPQNPVILKDVKGEIVFKNLSFKYKNDDEYVLKNINFTISPGEKIGIVGKIGSGKTTLVNILVRLFNVEENTVFIDGNDLMKCDISSIRDAIAYAPQDNFLFSSKISENISFSSNVKDDTKIIEAAKFADVDSNIEEFKDKYDTITGERGVTLSGGQKQRISLARAYYKDSPILILDDTVSAVDVKTEETIINNIFEKRKDKTTIVIASRISTVKGFDKILILKDGQIDSFDTPQNLEKNSDTYKKMVFLQELEKEVNA